MGYILRCMIPEIKRRSTHRASIIEGQFKALRKAIEDEAYCMDILTQSLAIQKSLASLNKLIVENHISTHIQDMFTDGSETKREQALTELSRLYELNNNRGK